VSDVMGIVVAAAPPIASTTTTTTTTITTPPLLMLLHSSMELAVDQPNRSDVFFTLSILFIILFQGAK